MSQFFEKRKLTNICLDQLKKKREVQINKIRNKRWDITTDVTETERIIKYYHQHNIFTN
jgi:hypothetical protein